jgi:uncharacterized protein (DUF1501 family)
MNMLTRRKLLQAMSLTAAAGSLPGLALAKADTEKRLVLVVLRGAVDGLALAPPYGDGQYGKVRGELALDGPNAQDGVLKLDGLFGLHPSLPNLHGSYQAGEALVVHAVASPYRERSHFDGQDLLESGATQVGALRDGWLNRSLPALPGTSAIAMAQNTPLVLRGDIATSSWAPSRLPDADDSTIGRLQRLYAEDEFFATRLEQALRAQEIAMDMGDGGQRGNEARQFGELAAAAARFLDADDGPRIAVLEFGGWDTHANQGTSSGQLANRFAALDTGLDNLKNGLGENWDQTVVVVATEFGRTVQVNGTRGTDHGTATAALLLGGAVNGGRVIADWPGLGNGDLYEGRDLSPTTDLRSVFKGVLAEHLDMPSGFIDRDVFPDSAAAQPLRDLIRG